MSLTDAACKNADFFNPNSRKKLFDGGGLYLHLRPTSKLWKLKYYFLGVEKTFSIGSYPIISLKDAREQACAAKRLIAEGHDPNDIKRRNRASSKLMAANTFKSVAVEWHGNAKEGWTEKYAANVLHKMETDLFPALGNRPIAKIEPPELLEVVRRVEQRGAVDIARRCKQIAGQVFRFGIATGKCSRDISADLKDALKRAKVTHFAALLESEIPAFLQTLSRNDARLYPQTRRALTMLAHVFVRPSELSNAKKEEFNLDINEWVIPAERMKMRVAHIVPLSWQVVGLIREQLAETAHLHTEYLFPSLPRPAKPMSNGTLLHALYSLGYDKRQTAHGFRSVARTIIRERLEYDPDIIERQLAHGQRDKVVAAYDRAKFLPQRKKMMQDWSNYLCAAEQGNKVIIASFNAGKKGEARTG